MICSVFKTHESKGPVTYWDTEQLFQDGAPVVMSVKDGASDLIKPTVFITERAADCTVVPPKSAFIVFSRVCACGH